jgi:hypothetical protein
MHFKSLEKFVFLKIENNWKIEEKLTSREINGTNMPIEPEIVV